MAQVKRRVAITKRGKAASRLGGHAGKREGAKPKARLAGRREGSRAKARKAATPAGTKERRKAAQKQAFEAFDRQIGPLWDRLEDQCRQFAQGFNQEMGANQLHVDSNPAGLMVRLPTDGAEAFFQLDRDARHVSVMLSTGCTSFGSCITDQAPVGLAILDGQLRFLFGGAAISEEDLAVRILTDLIEADAPKQVGAKLTP
jgi:hypothetical protein